MDTVFTDLNNPHNLKIILLKPQRILNRPHKSKRTVRAIKIIGRTVPVRVNHPLHGEYGLRVAEIAARATTRQITYDWSQQQIRIAVGRVNMQALKAIHTLESEKGKTGGAAVKRRMRAIEVFKQSRSNFALLLNSSRKAIGGIMGLRRQIADSMDDEIKYLYFRGVETPYTSKAYLEDLNAIENILNRDIDLALSTYHTLKLNESYFNELVEQYNSALVVQAK